MKSYQQRAVNDKAHIDERREEVRQFVMNKDEQGKFKELDQREQDLLIGQLQIMGQLSDILSKRIDLFK